MQSQDLAYRRRLKRVATTEVVVGNVVNYHGIRIAVDHIRVVATDYGPCHVASGLILNLDAALQDNTARWLLGHRSEALTASGRESVQGTALGMSYVEI